MEQIQSYPASLPMRRVVSSQYPLHIHWLKVSEPAIHDSPNIHCLHQFSLYIQVVEQPVNFDHHVATCVRHYIA